jgi:hypothetical protein
MLCREIIAGFLRFTQTLCGQNVEYFYLKVNYTAVITAGKSDEFPVRHPQSIRS